MRCAPPHHGTLIRPGTLRCSVVARNNDILKRLVLEAKHEYEKDAERLVHIFMADTYVPLLITRHLRGDARTTTPAPRPTPTELTSVFILFFRVWYIRYAHAGRTGAGDGTARARSGP